MPPPPSITQINLRLLNRGVTEFYRILPLNRFRIHEVSLVVQSTTSPLPRFVPKKRWVLQGLNRSDAIQFWRMNRRIDWIQRRSMVLQHENPSVYALSGTEYSGQVGEESETHFGMQLETDLSDVDAMQEVWVFENRFCVRHLVVCHDIIILASVIDFIADQRQPMINFHFLLSGRHYCMCCAQLSASRLSRSIVSKASCFHGWTCPANHFPTQSKSKSSWRSSVWIMC